MDKGINKDLLEKAVNLLKMKKERESRDSIEYYKIGRASCRERVCDLV